MSNQNPEQTKGKIEDVDLDLIKPYFRNPRVPNESPHVVAESIKRYGFNVPIVVDQKNVIICGHTRYRAARILGLKKAPVIKVDLNEKLVRQYRIADNKSSEMARWDTKALKAELEVMGKINEVRELFGTPEWDALLKIEPEAPKPKEQLPAEYTENFDVMCPNCGQQNHFTKAELAALPKES